MDSLLKYYERFKSKKYTVPGGQIVIALFVGEWLILIAISLLFAVVSQIIYFQSDGYANIIQSFLDSYVFIILIVLILFFIRYWLFKVIYSIHKKKNDIKYRYLIFNVIIGEILIGILLNTVTGSVLMGNMLEYNSVINTIFEKPGMLTLFFIFAVPVIIGLPAYCLAGKRVDKSTIKT
jgi:hypothetical protein